MRFSVWIQITWVFAGYHIQYSSMVNHVVATYYPAAHNGKAFRCINFLLFVIEPEGLNSVDGLLYG